MWTQEDTVRPKSFVLKSSWSGSFKKISKVSGFCLMKNKQNISLWWPYATKVSISWSEALQTNWMNTKAIFLVGILGFPSHMHLSLHTHNLYLCLAFNSLSTNSPWVLGIVLVVGRGYKMNIKPGPCSPFHQLSIAIVPHIMVCLAI